MKKRKYFHWQTLLLYGVAVVLFLIPFFWLKPGEVVLGGDSGRLYFIDPISSLHTMGLYGLFPAGNGPVEVMFITVPYLLWLALLKVFVHSPTLMICLENGLKLSLSYLAVSLIVRTILSTEDTHNKKIERILLAVLSGIVYVAFSTRFGWGVSLYIHNYIFLYPLITYLSLLFILKNQWRYIFAILTMTLLYSPCFGFTALSQMVSFFPFAYAFLFLYTAYVLKRSFPWKQFLTGAVLFVCLHAFHILPLIMSFFGQGSKYIQMGVSTQYSHTYGMMYFENNRRELGKISANLFQPLITGRYPWIIIFIPVIFILGYLKNPKSKMLTIIGIFFLTTLFFVSANVTQIGVSFYRTLFLIPGFTMFRSFNEKWHTIFSFFYAIGFGVSLFWCLHKQKRIMSFFVCALIAGIIILYSMPFFRGEAVNPLTFSSKSERSVIRLDPAFMDTLSYVKTLPFDGKMLTLPLTFPYFQLLLGEDGGMYGGLSFFSFLGKKPDFAGFWQFGPYKDAMAEALKEQNVKHFLELSSLLNIRYVYHNSDTRILDAVPGYPYGSSFDPKLEEILMGAFHSQKTYESFLAQLPLTRIFQKGSYSLYELKEDVVRPLAYIPDSVYPSLAETIEGESFRSAFVDTDMCKNSLKLSVVCGKSEDQPFPEVFLTQESPVSYRVQIDTHGAKTPFLLIFSNEFHPSWKLSFINMTGSPQVLEHIKANGYANGWIVKPDTKSMGSVYEGEITLGFQQYFVIGSIISVVTIVIGIIGIAWMKMMKKI